MIKEKVNKLGFIKIKNLCSFKETIKQVKRQAKHWEKVFAITCYLTQDFCPECIKNFYKREENNNTIFKWTQPLSRHFSGEDTQIIMKHMKRGSAPRHQGKKPKITMRYRENLSRLAKIKKTNNISARLNWYKYFGKSLTY